MPRPVCAEIAAQVERLLIEEGPAVYRCALRALQGNVAEAEDLVQEAFEAAMLNWARVGGFSRSRQRAWLCRVVRNKAVDRWRSSRRLSRLDGVLDLDDSTDTERVALSAVAADRCIRAINSMPPVRHRVAYLRWRMEWSTAEIAAELGITGSAVRWHLGAARDQLGTAIGDELAFLDSGEDAAHGEEVR